MALDVGQETLSLVGPSGAGKSTLLRVVAGLVRPEHGSITLGGRTLVDTRRRVGIPPELRRVGLLFQDGGLFPHMTVADNVAFAMRGRRDQARLGSLLHRFGLHELARAKPPSLSGGERQRVSLARAVASDPQALLLDEPLSALDPVSKSRVGAELSSHLRALGLPTILVSHDFADVIGLGDRIAVMEAGRIVQMGSAGDLLQAPERPFVAALTGVNYLPGTARLRGDLTEVRTDEGGIVLSTEPASGRVAAVVSPWDIALSPSAPQGSAMNALAGPVNRIAGVGNRVRVTVGSSPAVVAEVTEESVVRLALGPGVSVVASWKATGTRLVALGDTFDAASDRLYEAPEGSVAPSPGRAVG